MTLPVLFIDRKTGELSEPVPSKAEGWYPVAGDDARAGYTSNPRMAERQRVSVTMRED